ncbi:MAG: 50S ribosomal protein L4 [Candidatus Hydrogenedentota bacterium]|nr:MAG: 50S ribosomal protein L4 [Candidatus Hydrogenedentota bacterium]
MASTKVYKSDGSEGSTVDLNDAVFDIEPNVGLVHQVAMALLANKRQGNAETKTRKEVRGGGRKPFRQKGTGNARQGSTREPHMRGGGVVFGPHKRSYRQEVPLKMRRKALCCVLTDRVRSEQLCVLEGLADEQPKTSPMVDLLEKVSPEGRKTLLITNGTSDAVLTSSRNIPRLTVRTATDVNALDVLSARRVVCVQDALATLEARLS